jgi:hypothetical protein
MACELAHHCQHRIANFECYPMSEGFPKPFDPHNRIEYPITLTRALTILGKV